MNILKNIFIAIVLSIILSIIESLMSSLIVIIYDITNNDSLINANRITILDVLILSLGYSYFRYLINGILCVLLFFIFLRLITYNKLMMTGNILILSLVNSTCYLASIILLIKLEPRFVNDGLYLYNVPLNLIWLYGYASFTSPFILFFLYKLIDRYRD